MLKLLTSVFSDFFIQKTNESHCLVYHVNQIYEIMFHENLLQTPGNVGLSNLYKELYARD